MSERDVLAKANDKTADTEGSEKKDASSALVAEAHDAWSKTSENVDLTTVASVGASIIAGPLAGLATFAAARYGSDKQESKSLVDASKAPEALPQSIREKQTPEKISDSSEVTTHGTPGKENYSSQHTAGESQSQSRSELTAARIVKTAAEAASTTRSSEQIRESKPDSRVDNRSAESTRTEKPAPAVVPDKPTIAKPDRAVESGNTEKPVSRQNNVQTDEDSAKTFISKQDTPHSDSPHANAEPSHLEMTPLRELVQPSRSLDQLKPLLPDQTKSPSSAAYAASPSEISTQNSNKTLQPNAADQHKVMAPEAVAGTKVLPSKDSADSSFKQNEAAAREPQHADTAIPGNAGTRQVDSSSHTNGGTKPADTAVPGNTAAKPVDTTVPGNTAAKPVDTALPGNTATKPVDTALPSTAGTKQVDSVMPAVTPGGTNTKQLDTGIDKSAFLPSPPISAAVHPGDAAPIIPSVSLNKPQTGVLPELVASATKNSSGTLSSGNAEHFVDQHQVKPEGTPVTANKDTAASKDSSTGSPTAHSVLGIPVVVGTPDHQTKSTAECNAGDSPNKAETMQKSPIAVNGSDAPGVRPITSTLPPVIAKNGADVVQRPTEGAERKTDGSVLPPIIATGQKGMADTVRPGDAKQSNPGALNDVTKATPTVLDKTSAPSTDSTKGLPAAPASADAIRLSPTGTQGPMLSGPLDSAATKTNNVPGALNDRSATPPELLSKMGSSIPAGSNQAIAQQIINGKNGPIVLTDAAAKTNQNVPTQDRNGNPAILTRLANTVDSIDKGIQTALQTRQGRPVANIDGKLMPQGLPADKWQLTGAQPGTDAAGGLLFKTAGYAGFRWTGDTLVIRNVIFQPTALPADMLRQWFPCVGNGGTFSPSTCEILRILCSHRTGALQAQPPAGNRTDVTTGSGGSRTEPNVRDITRIDPVYTQSFVRGGGTGGSTSLISDSTTPRTTTNDANNSTSQQIRNIGNDLVPRYDTARDAGERRNVNHDSRREPTDPRRESSITRRGATEDPEHRTGLRPVARYEQDSANGRSAGRGDIIDKGGQIINSDRSTGGRDGHTNGNFVVDFVAGALGLAGIRRATDGKPIKAENPTAQITNQIYADRRTRYIIKFGDSLEQIAAAKLGDARFANLLLTINRSRLVFTVKDGKQVAILKPGEAIWLPSESELSFYKRFFFNNKPDSLLLEIKQTGSPAEFQAPALLFTPPRLCIVDDKNSEQVPNMIPSPQDAGPISLVLYRLRHAGGRGSVPLNLTIPGAGPAGERRKYRVRLGDTLRSVALNDPLIGDQTCWPLIAQINNLSDQCDGNGRPMAVLVRGQVIELPNPEEVQRFRLLHRMQQSTAGSDQIANARLVEDSRYEAAARLAVQKLSEDCRIIGTASGGAHLSTRLQTSIQGNWTTIAAYESQGNESYRYVYRRNGSRLACRFDLPQSVVATMAREDFRRNFRTYVRNFYEDDNSSKARIVNM